jgi:anti-anti-sigma factor
MGVACRTLSLLTLTTSHEHETVRVALEGELDLSSALTFDEELRRIEDDAEEQTLLLDLESLKFMDSTGLRLIVSAHQRAVKAGRRLAICGASQTIRRILRLTGMHERLHIVDGGREPAARGPR